jgi:hypothetical protein
MALGVDRRLGSARLACVAGLVALANVGCSSSSEDVDSGCQWQRRTVEREEQTAVLNASVAEVGERFHVGEEWSCRVSWSSISEQSEAEWSPAETDVEATLVLDWGDRAEEVTGSAQEGRRGVCLSYLDIGLEMSLQASDGSLAENWSVVGTYQSKDELSVDVRPHELGGYQGSYSLRWLSDLPETGSVLSVVLRPDGAVGDIIEWTARTAAGGDSGDGVQVSPASWTCER